MWDEEKLKPLPVKNNFRLRGLVTTRMETFIDAAFAFAVTMLVISVGDIPNNYTELITALKGSPAFLLSFAAVMLFWLGHRRWSRRYGLEDGVSVAISLGLIFLMLVYVYPLRLMFSAMVSAFTDGWLPSEFNISDPMELIGLFVIYGLGFSFMAGLMALLFNRPIQLRNKLTLDKLELFITKQEVVLWAILSLTGLVSGLFALLLPPRIAIYAGFIYFSLPFTMNITAFYYQRKAKKIKSGMGH